MQEVLRSYNGEVDWNVGSLFAHDLYMIKLIDVCKEIGIEVPIKYVFGSIPCILQGGRIPPRTATLSSAFDIMDMYNSRGIGCRLTFSSNIIENDDMKDELCNELMKHLNENKKNGVIVSNDTLAKYIKDNYYNLEVISSLVKPSVEVGLGNDVVEYYNKLFDTYDLVVINPFKVYDGRFLKEIEHKDRVEFIVNHHCRPDCPMAGKHYDILNRINRKDMKNEDYNDELNELREIDNYCTRMEKKFPLAGTSYSYTDIEMLVRMGFKHFKIEGRENSGETFIRDIGDYIFIPNMHSRLARSVLHEEIKED